MDNERDVPLPVPYQWLDMQDLHALTTYVARSLESTHLVDPHYT